MSVCLFVFIFVCLIREAINLDQARALNRFFYSKIYHKLSIFREFLEKKKQQHSYLFQAVRINLGIQWYYLCGLQTKKQL